MTLKDKTQNVRIALVQMSCSADLQKNLSKAVSLVEKAAAKGAKIISLQELFRSEYFCKTEESKNFDLAETIPGPSTEVLSKLAKKLKVVIIASLFEKRSKGVYHNTAIVLDADGSL